MTTTFAAFEILRDGRAILDAKQTHGATVRQAQTLAKANPGVRFQVRYAGDTEILWDSHFNPVPLRQGVKHWGDGAGLSWAVFPASVADESACATFSSPYNGGPGRSFTNRACVRRSRTRVLVTQSFGLDI